MFSENYFPHHLWEDFYLFVGTGQYFKCSRLLEALFSKDVRGESTYFSSPTFLESPNNKIFIEQLSGKIYFLKMSFGFLIGGRGLNIC